MIHNASFDIDFIYAELDGLKLSPILHDRLVDTPVLARRKHPGVSNRLDDLCSRYATDNSHRTEHGALLNALLEYCFSPQGPLAPLPYRCSAWQAAAGGAAAF